RHRRDRRGLSAPGAPALSLRLREPLPAAPPPLPSPPGGRVGPRSRPPRRAPLRSGPGPRHPGPLGGLSALPPLAALRGGDPEEALGGLAAETLLLLLAQHAVLLPWALRNRETLGHFSFFTDAVGATLF